jgi:hypothetical protein
VGHEAFVSARVVKRFEDVLVPTIKRGEYRHHVQQVNIIITYNNGVQKVAGVLCLADFSARECATGLINTALNMVNFIVRCSSSCHPVV